jgi:uncharacterized protein
MAPLREIEQASRRIERYGTGTFRIEGTVHQGAVLLTQRAVTGWNTVDLAQATADDVAPIIAAREDFEFVLIGSGARMTLMAKAAREALKAAGVRFDVMDTGAACRTFNVLVAEGRRVAAALIPVP